MEGGKFWQLVTPNGYKFISRHMTRIIKTGIVKEGDLVAITGNSGKFTTNPHLHQEVYKNGVLINPETLIWSSSLKEENMLRTYNGTIYALVAGFWMAIGTSYPEFLVDFGNQAAPSMTEAQFKAFPVHKRTIKCHLNLS